MAIATMATPSLASTPLVTASLRTLNNYVALLMDEPSSFDDPNILTMMNQLLVHISRSVHNTWNFVANDIPDIERLYDHLPNCKRNTDEATALGKRAAFLLSMIYFHLGNVQQACEWAFHSGTLLAEEFADIKQQDPNRDTIIAYRRSVTANLVENYASAEKAIQEDKTKSAFVKNLIEQTIEEAAVLGKRSNEQRELILMVYGIAMKAESINWIILLIERFPYQVQFLLNHHLRRLINEPKNWTATQDEELPDSELEDDHRVMTLKTLVDAACVLSDNLAGLMASPYTHYSFTHLRDSVQTVTPLTEDDRIFISKRKGASRLAELNILVARDTTKESDDKPVTDKGSEGLDAEASTIVEGPSKEDDSEAPLVEASIPMTDGADSDKEDESDYEKSYKLQTRAILFLQPLVDIWDALVYMWDARKISKMLVNLLAGKCCWIGGVASSEGRVLALQLILDLVVYENPRLVQRVTESQEAVRSKLRDSNNLRNVLRRIMFCLTGRVSSHLRLECLSRYTRAEPKLLEQLRQNASGNESLVHQGLMICHGIVTAGTTSDLFLRHNVDWYKKAICWAKFTGASTLGLTHRGHTENSKSSGLPRSLTILRNYLPPTPGILPNGETLAGGSTGGSYSEGGGLYAVGLIHACTPNDVVKKMFLHHLTATDPNVRANENRDDGDVGGLKSDPIHHGSALALGLVYATTHDSDVMGHLRDCLYNENSVVGEACAIASGMVSCNFVDHDTADTLVQYSSDTGHEKIVRGCGLGAALIFMDRQGEAEEYIDRMINSNDQHQRYGAVWMITAAYIATGNTATVRRLLNLSVDDTCNDVRRTAIMGLGFLLCRPEHRQSLTSTVALLMDSYNPHIRYGAAMALGVGCASTGDLRAIGLLRPLAEDPVAFVRHGALIALGLVLCSVSEAEENVYADVRKDFLKIAKTKQEDSLVRFAALLGIGLCNAGGGNITISLLSTPPRGASGQSANRLNIVSAMGLLLFCNYWFWFPLINMITLSMKGTLTCGLTYRLQVPHDYFVWDTAPPNRFPYPEPTAEVSTKKSKRKASPFLNKRMLQRRKLGELSAEEVKKKEAEEAEKSKVEKEQKEKEAADALKNKPGFWVSIPARITQTRARGITSGIELSKKSPPYFSEEQIKRCDGRSSKVPVLDCGPVHNEVPHARYVPIMHKRHEGLVVLLDRWSELRMPVLSNVVMAIDSKKKSDKDKPQDVTEGEVEATETTETTVDATTTTNGAASSAITEDPATEADGAVDGEDDTTTVDADAYDATMSTEVTRDNGLTDASPETPEAEPNHNSSAAEEDAMDKEPSKHDGEA